MNVFISIIISFVVVAVILIFEYGIASLVKADYFVLCTILSAVAMFRDVYKRCIKDLNNDH